MALQGFRSEEEVGLVAAPLVTEEWQMQEIEMPPIPRHAGHSCCAYFMTKVGHVKRTLAVAAVGALVLLACTLQHFAPLPFGISKVPVSSPLTISKKPKLLVADDAMGTSTCAALTLKGNGMVKIGDSCAAVKVGASCIVKCAQGFEGDPVRFFCFSQLAANGKPPAAIREPTCRKTGTPIFKDGSVQQLAWDAQNNDGSEQQRSWESESCLQCLAGGDCVAAKTSNECTDFTLQLHANERRWEAVTTGQMCLSLSFTSSVASLVKCNKKKAEASFWPNAEGNMLCTNDLKSCLKPFTPISKLGFVPPSGLLQPALDALAANKSNVFLKEALSLQMCKAKLESGAHDEFWHWLEQQSPSLRKALFSTFPVTPGQVRLFSEIVDLVGTKAFQKEGMAPFVVALSYFHRWKKLDEPVLIPMSGPRNSRSYLKTQMGYVKEDLSKGRHYSSTFEYQKCGEASEGWKFSWPRSPMPSIREWVHWWRSKVNAAPTAVWYDGSGGLWQNPLHTPWTFSLYLSPSPLDECEWVHQKVIDKETMEGSWYNYKKGEFQDRICEGGKYAPDSLMGIAVYGGICGRMSELARGKTGCMGLPAVQVGQPKHSAAAMMMPLPVGIRTALSASIFGPHRCLVCKGNKKCTTDVAGAIGCSMFRYDPKEHLILLEAATDRWKMLKKGEDSNNKCLEVQKKKGELVVQLRKCVTGKHSMLTTQEAHGQLVINSDKGVVKFAAAGGGVMPEVQRPWAWQKIQFVQCTQSKCDFDSITANLDASSASLFRNVHVEAWLAAAEAYNDHQRDGTWPVAHDEARLAASLAVASAKAEPKLSNIEEAFAWALARNPSVYEIWEAAADYAGFTSNKREELASRQWFNALKNSGPRIPESELSRRLLEAAKEGEEQKARAERFVRRHLLASQHQSHWSRHPGLHQDITMQLCEALTKEMLPLLEGAAGAKCRRFRQLMESQSHELVGNGTASEFKDSGNQVPDEFDDVLRALKHLKTGAAQQALRGLLGALTVGFVNTRSETFFGQHHRIMMRGPYVAALKYAGDMLPKKERVLLFSTTRRILEHPEDWPHRIFAAPASLKTRFLGWVAKPQLVPQHLKLQESLQTSEDLLHEMSRDQDSNAELADDAEEMRDIEEILYQHLQLSKDDMNGLNAQSALKGSEETEHLRQVSVGGQDEASIMSTLKKPRRLASANAGPTPSDVLQMCVKDLQDHVKDDFWGR